MMKELEYELIDAITFIRDTEKNIQYCLDEMTRRMRVLERQRKALQKKLANLKPKDAR